MTLTLHAHPLSAYCQKAIIALYELDCPFERHHLDLQDAAVRKAFLSLWPMGKMPVLEDSAYGKILPEASLIIEYLDRRYPGPVPLLPPDPDTNLDARQWDRILDLYVQTPMQKYIVDRLRPKGTQDTYGVEEAMRILQTSYGMLDKHLAGRTWLAGDSFSLADCGAGPALFYSGCIVAFADTFPNLSTYFERLLARPTVTRALEEAKPWLHLVPIAERIPSRFR
jgi:glutathione S-transferase